MMHETALLQGIKAVLSGVARWEMDAISTDRYNRSNTNQSSEGAVVLNLHYRNKRQENMIVSRRIYNRLRKQGNGATSQTHEIHYARSSVSR